MTCISIALARYGTAWQLSRVDSRCACGACVCAAQLVKKLLRCCAERTAAFQPFSSPAPASYFSPPDHNSTRRIDTMWSVQDETKGAAWRGHWTRGLLTGKFSFLPSVLSFLSGILCVLNAYRGGEAILPRVLERVRRSVAPWTEIALCIYLTRKSDVDSGSQRKEHRIRSHSNRNDVNA
jgi:hypothetical protein